MSGLFSATHILFKLGQDRPYVYRYILRMECGLVGHLAVRRDRPSLMQPVKYAGVIVPTQ